MTRDDLVIALANLENMDPQEAAQRVEQGIARAHPKGQYGGEVHGLDGQPRYRVHRFGVKGRFRMSLSFRRAEGGLVRKAMAMGLWLLR